MRQKVLGLAIAALLVAAGAATAPRATASTALSPAKTYVVLYRQAASPPDAAASIVRAGGTVVADYHQIGVVIARAADATFASRLGRDGRIEGVAATDRFGAALSHPGDGELPNAPATDADNLSALQWDMRQINAPEAHAITGGSPSVLVGNIDTGVDKDHPDLIPNLDLANSASCESGAPDQNPQAWDDRQGHGTHTAGTIAADDNGIGIVGVAPNVRVAAIKASTDEGYFFPEMVICAFMWAGARHMDVTNNSYFADPFLYNCRNDPVQRAIWKAEQRAILWAQKQGVTVVASAGNESDDMSHPTVDVISPDYPPGNEQEREITNACVKVPVEVPGVIGVSAVGNTQQAPGEYLKSWYSSYGVSAVDVTAPGGDGTYGRTAEAPNGRVLSTYPADRPCSRSVTDPTQPPSTYCYLQGTSMAGPHVAGVAALVISLYGDASNPQNGKMRPHQVEQHITQTARPQACPDDANVPAGYYENFPQTSGEPQSCQGGPGFNGWYGNGHVDALRAVLHDTSNR